MHEWKTNLMFGIGVTHIVLMIVDYKVKGILNLRVSWYV
jgi:hypothetical protein